jgi:hypothetical protein
MKAPFGGFSRFKLYYRPLILTFQNPKGLLSFDDRRIAGPIKSVARLANKTPEISISDLDGPS